MRQFKFFSLLFLALACTPGKEKIPDLPTMTTQPKKIVLYQAMVRLFGNQHSANKAWGTIAENGVGKFNDINDTALTSLAGLGVTHVWYTGVLEHAVLTDYTKFGIPLDHPEVVKGRAGSPYAIKDYYDVDPDLAVDVPKRMAEFEALVARTHAHHLKAIIDFVPNHVARAYHSDVKPDGVKDLGQEDDVTAAFKPANNFYYLPGQAFQPPKREAIAGMSVATQAGQYHEMPAKASGNDQFTASPSVNDWFETVKLNYGIDIINGKKAYFDPVPDTWVKMKDILIYWANKNVDGFRCDMAEMVPVEFWAWAIPQVKAVSPGVVFIAEIYNPAEYRNYLTKGKFDYLYDKVQLYDLLRVLTNQKSKTEEIARVQDDLKGINSHMVHFLENHDEQRIASSFFAGDPFKAVPAMVVSATIDAGPVMIYFGQEVGEPGAGAEGFSSEDGRTSIFDYWGVPAHQKWMNGGKFDGGGLSIEQKQLRQFYGDILNFAATNPAIVGGDYLDLTRFNTEKGQLSPLVHAFVRTKGEERLLIVSNFNSKLERVKIQLTPEAIAAMQLRADIKYIGRDLLRSGMDIGFDASFLTEVEIPAHSAFIFKIKS